jgi:hypothetical protein
MEASQWGIENFLGLGVEEYLLTYIVISFISALQQRGSHFYPGLSGGFIPEDFRVAIRGFRMSCYDKKNLAKNFVRLPVECK